jgi:hypothetical protein
LVFEVFGVFEGGVVEDEEVAECREKEVKESCGDPDRGEDVSIGIFIWFPPNVLECS